MARTTIPPITEPATIPPIFFELDGVGEGVFYQNLKNRGNTVVEEAELPGPVPPADAVFKVMVEGLIVAVLDAYGNCGKGNIKPTDQPS
jgi:hypothetical protein